MSDTVGRIEQLTEADRRNLEARGLRPLGPERPAAPDPQFIAESDQQPDIAAELRKLIAEFGRDAVVAAIERLASEEAPR